MKDPNNTVVELSELPHTEDSDKPFNSPVLSPNLPAAAWPTEPVPLVPAPKDGLFIMLYDAVLVFVPILLMVKIGLIIFAWRLDMYHTSTQIDQVSLLTTFLIEFNAQMVTAFTVIFVTIVSTLVKRYALFKAQKGAYISELEQLQGSISMTSTLKLIWSLRQFTTTSIYLMLIWSFYYLGSQAATREYQLVSSDMFHKVPAGVAGDLLSGFDPNVRLSSFWTISDVNLQLNSETQFQSSLAHNSGTDSQRYPLVPDLDSFLHPDPDSISSQKPAKVHRHGWVDVSKQSKTSVYTSLIGMPIWRAPSYHTAFTATGGQVLGDYLFPTNYLRFGCGGATLMPYESFPNGTLANQSISLNMTQASTSAATDLQGNALRNFNLWMRWPNMSNIDANITQAAGSLQVTCNITQVNVDVKVHCLDSGCFPNKMRYRNNVNQSAATSFGTPLDNDQLASNLFSNFLLSSGLQPNMTDPTMIGQRVGGAVLYSLLSDSAALTDSLANNVQSSADALNLYLNTYYMVSQTQANADRMPYMATVIATGTDGSWNLTTLDGAEYNPHYAIFWYWIALDFTSCLILLLASVAACWLRTRTLAPDIFGYVSSMTRDNPLLELPNNGTTIGGLQRSRMLGKIKVKIGDVSDTSEEVGRVGLARVDTGNIRIDELRRETTYA